MFKKIAGRLILFIAVLFIFSLLYHSPAKEYSQSLDGQSRELSGHVCSEPEEGIAKQTFIFCSQLGRILITTILYPHYEYGDVLLIAGRLQVPKKFNSFDYGRYLERYGVYLLSYYPKIEKKGQRTSFYRSLLRFKGSWTALINKSLPEPEAGLASAIMLGYRKTLDEGDKEKFARIGLSHMIVISGSHIAILSALFWQLLLFLGFSRRSSFIFIALFLAAYVVLSGLQASATRSALMGVMALLAYRSGRLIKPLNILLFCVALMMAFNPWLLRSDIGFQLSISAILGIIYLYPPLQALFIRKYPNFLSQPFLSWKKVFLNTLCLTLACQLATAPILIISFRRLSLIAPLSNILVLWIFPFLMTSLIFASLLAIFVPSLSTIFFWPSYIFLKVIFLVASFLADLPFAQFDFS